MSGAVPARPWRAIEWFCQARTTIATVAHNERGAPEEIVAECGGQGRSCGQAEQIAAFIERACNSHDALLMDLRRIHESNLPPEAFATFAREVARTALSVAEAS